MSVRHIRAVTICDDGSLMSADVGGDALLVLLLGGMCYVVRVLLMAIVKEAITTLLGMFLGAQGPTSIGYTPGRVFL